MLQLNLIKLNTLNILGTPRYEKNSFERVVMKAREEAEILLDAGVVSDSSILFFLLFSKSFIKTILYLITT